MGQVAKAEDSVEARNGVARKQPGKRWNWRRSRIQMGAAPYAAGGGARRGEDVFIGAVAKKHMEMGFEVCDVRKALAAVSRITAKGNRVAFGPETEDNFIENVKTGQKSLMRKKG